MKEYKFQALFASAFLPKSILGKPFPNWAPSINYP